MFVIFNAYTSKFMSTYCCYVEIQDTVPQLTTGKSCPSWRRVRWRALIHRGQWEWERDRGSIEEAGERTLSHAAQRTESRRCWAGWLTGVWIHHSRGNGWNSKPWLESHSTCVYLTRVCADEPTHPRSQSRTHTHTHTWTRTSRKGRFLVGVA